MRAKESNKCLRYVLGLSMSEEGFGIDLVGAVHS
jgi:hypothetical protein